MSQKRRPTVSKADYDRAAAFLRSIGASVAAVEIEPGKVRIITTAGRSLMMGETEEQMIDRELAAFRAEHGYG